MIVSSCGALAALFFGAIVMGVLGNVLGLIAWRDRQSGRPRWGCLVDPSYLLRGENFRNPRHPARIGALLLLLGGIACLLLVAAALIQAQRSGATNVCGFAF